MPESMHESPPKKTIIKKAHTVGQVACEHPGAEILLRIYETKINAFITDSI